MKKQWLCLCLAGLLVLPGCGKSTKSAVEDDFEQVKESSATESDATASDEEIPDHMKYTITSEQGNASVEVDAEVFSDGSDQVSVYKAKNEVLDEEYVTKLAESVFDNKDYTIELPYVAMTEEKLQYLIDGQCANHGDGVWTYPIAQMDDLLFAVEDGKNYLCPSEYDATKMFYDGYMEESYFVFMQSADTTIKMNIEIESGEIDNTQGYKGARLSGAIDGKPCEMSVKIKENAVMDHVWIYSSDDEIKFVYTYMDYELYKLPENQQNPCDYMSAQTIADSVLKKILPDADYELAGSYHRMVYKSGITDQLSADGYRFCYTPRINELLIPMNSYCVQSDEAVQPIICIDVNENGFLSAKFSQSVVQGEVLTRNAKLLSFEQVNAAFKNEVEAEMSQELTDASAPIVISKIKFSYVLVDSEGEKVFLPYWLFYNENPNGELKRECALWGVNALDGSVCNFGVASDDYVLIDNIF